MSQTSPLDPDIDPADQFIEQMGLVMQRDGGARIAGRIYGLLLIEGRRYGLAEMAERLQVSKASISTNARFLDAAGVIRRVAVPGKRQDYYELVASPFERIMVTMSDKMRQAAQDIEAAEAQLSPELAQAKGRIGELARFYRDCADMMLQWHHRQDADRQD